MDAEADGDGDGDATESEIPHLPTPKVAPTYATPSTTRSMKNLPAPGSPLTSRNRVTRLGLVYELVE